MKRDKVIFDESSITYHPDKDIVTGSAKGSEENDPITFTLMKNEENPGLYKLEIKRWILRLVVYVDPFNQMPTYREVYKGVFGKHHRQEVFNFVNKLVDAFPKTLN